MRRVAALAGAGAVLVVVALFGPPVLLATANEIAPADIIGGGDIWKLGVAGGALAVVWKALDMVAPAVKAALARKIGADTPDLAAASVGSREAVEEVRALRRDIAPLAAAAAQVGELHGLLTRKTETGAYVYLEHSRQVGDMLPVLMRSMSALTASIDVLADRMRTPATADTIPPQRRAVGTGGADGG